MVSSIGVCEAIVERGRLAKDSNDLRSIESYPILSSPSPDQFSYYSEAGSPGYVARMMLTIGTKDIHSGPFLQLMVLDKIVSATATGARRFFYDRERPLQQLQPHKIMPYSAPRWVKSNPCSGLTLIAMPY
jgi:hypothetical protein